MDLNQQKESNMKKMNGAISWIMLAAVLLIGAGSSLVWKKSGKNYEDNPVEEIAEDILKAKTGIDADFTPGSKEK